MHILHIHLALYLLAELVLCASNKQKIVVHPLVGLLG